MLKHRYRLQIMLPIHNKTSQNKYILFSEKYYSAVLGKNFCLFKVGTSSLSFFRNQTMSKLRILNEKNEAIVGILEKKTECDIDRQRPRLAIIVHGILGQLMINSLLQH